MGYLFNLKVEIIIKIGHSGGHGHNRNPQFAVHRYSVIRLSFRWIHAKQLRTREAQYAFDRYYFLVNWLVALTTASAESREKQIQQHHNTLMKMHTDEKSFVFNSTDSAFCWSAVFHRFAAVHLGPSKK